MTAALLGALLASADLLFPGGATLRVEATTSGDWHRFLGKLFDHFDRDADGTLSAAEVRRVFPLPLPGGREVAGGNGRATRAEFIAFYQRTGFTPAVVVNLAPTPADLRLTATVVHHLDRDGNGTLSRAELADAPKLLRRLDEDEDEALTPAELLVGAPVVRAANSPAWPEPSSARNPDAVLRVSFPKATFTARDATRFRTLTTIGPLRFTVPGGECVVAVSTDDPTTGAREAREFLLAQFRTATGEKPSLSKADADGDASLRGLAGLFDDADRNGNGQLTEAELTALLELIELGVSCQVVVTAEDRGRNLFDRLDENADGRLDLWELRRAPQRIPEEVPRGLRLTVSRGPVAPTFAGVPVVLPKKPAVRPARAADGPAWFRAADRNGDGFLSPAEFVGSAELFRRLDADGDGRVSAAEATAAK